MIQARNIDLSSVLEIVKVENSSNYAIKYTDGRLVCFMRTTVNVTSWTTTGGIVYGNQTTSRPNYPVPFTEPPFITAQLNTNYGSVNGWLYHSTNSATDTEKLTKVPKYNIARGASMTGTSTFFVDIVAQGFWK